MSNPHQAILLTGTPCTGKTSLAKAWCKKSGWAYLSLNELAEEKTLYWGVDKKDGAKIVKLAALKKEANRRIKSLASSSVLIEGHLGCEIKLDVRRVLVLRLHPDELAQRLSSRHYAPSKISENRMAELLDYCTIRSLENYNEKNVFEMDGSSKTLEQNLARFAEFASSPKPSAPFSPSISWSEELKKEAERQARAGF